MRECRRDEPETTDQNEKRKVGGSGRSASWGARPSVGAALGLGASRSMRAVRWRQAISDITVSRVKFHWGLSRSEEHTSELQSLMRISYAVFCLKKKKTRSQQD